MKLKIFALILSILSVTGCATTQKHPDDPLEPMNRAIYGFNEVVDKVAMRPIAKVYKAVTPDPIQLRVTNFLSNLGEIRNSLNSALQGKFKEAGRTFGRFLINSIIGLGGLHDIAGQMGSRRHEEDFGQTLGVWGITKAPYFVIPLLGPSTLRDLPGLVVDAFTEPYIYIEADTVRYSLTGLRLVDNRARLLNFDKTLSEQLDRYAFVRDSYLQKRDNDIQDGEGKDLEGFEFE